MHQTEFWIFSTHTQKRDPTQCTTGHSTGQVQSSKVFPLLSSYPCLRTLSFNSKLFIESVHCFPHTLSPPDSIVSHLVHCSNLIDPPTVPMTMKTSKCSVMSNSSCPLGLQPARLLCLWDSPGKNTGVGCHFLLQGIFPTQGWNPRLLLAAGFFTTAPPWEVTKSIAPSVSFLE